MTHQEKLNQILFCLMDMHKKKLKNEVLDKRVTFSFLCKVVAEVNEVWEVEFLKERLLQDGYMRPIVDTNNELFEITPEGIVFIQPGGYTRQLIDRETEQKIKEETLKKFRYDKWALFLAVLSLIVSVISLLKK